MALEFMFSGHADAGKIFRRSIEKEAREMHRDLTYRFHYRNHAAVRTPTITEIFAAVL